MAFKVNYKHFPNIKKKLCKYITVRLILKVVQMCKLHDYGRDMSVNLAMKLVQ